MAKKLTIQDINKFIEDKGQNQCTLLSTEYINTKTPLLLKCNLCGETFERDFDHLQRGRFTCVRCAKKKAGQGQRLTIEYVKNFIQQNDINHDCTLLSTDYQTTDTPLLLRCNICGKTFERDFHHIQRGRFRCEKCGELAGAKLNKYTVEDVAKDISKDKYNIIGPYINAGTGVLCYCEKHQIEFYLYYSEYRFSNRGCPMCGLEKISGPNHFNWHNGISLISDAFRSATNVWKQDILKQHPYCDITNVTDNLEVHHLNINYSDILQEALQNTNFQILPDKKNLSDYPITDIQKVKKEIQRLHYEKVQGVVLTKNVHKKFHQTYGYYNNSIEQYLHFKENYYKGE